MRHTHTYKSILNFSFRFIYISCFDNYVSKNEVCSFVAICQTRMITSFNEMCIEFVGNRRKIIALVEEYSRIFSENKYFRVWAPKPSLNKQSVNFLSVSLKWVSIIHFSFGVNSSSRHRFKSRYKVLLYHRVDAVFRENACELYTPDQRPSIQVKLSINFLVSVSICASVQQELNKIKFSTPLKTWLIYVQKLQNTQCAGLLGIHCQKAGTRLSYIVQQRVNTRKFSAFYY